MPIKMDFPSAGSEYLGGQSDGFVYRTAFAGSSLEISYEMLRNFLEEEGFEDIPLPGNLEELEMFKLSTRNKQILLFEDNGYVHNPIKILFPNDGRKKKTLILEIYNDDAPKHLLRFHGRLKE